METIKTIETAVNNAEYRNETTNKYAEAYKTRTIEILENKNTTFSEFIDEQSIATDISRLGGLKSGAMLNEQLKYVFGGLKSFTKSKEAVNNTSFTGVPGNGEGLTTTLGGPFTDTRLAA